MNALSAGGTPARAQLGTGVVRHHRLRPRDHAFAYPTYFLMLPMRTLRSAPCAALARNRRGLLSFHDCDHGLGGDDALAWASYAADPDARLHLYGKAEVRPGRKMGHVTWLMPRGG